MDVSVFFQNARIAPSISGRPQQLPLHFQLPSEWKGSSVWVYIEGSFHVTNSYFNGKHLGEHPAGYTSFWLKLSEGAKWGEENVLALHVNATTGTGWWCEPLASLSHSLNRTACTINTTMYSTIMLHNVYNTIF